MDSNRVQRLCQDEEYALHDIFCQIEQVIEYNARDMQHVKS